MMKALAAPLPSLERVEGRGEREIGRERERERERGEGGGREEGAEEKREGERVVGGRVTVEWAQLSLPTNYSMTMASNASIETSTAWPLQT